MTLCPVALVAGCKKCPAYSFCPAKGIIGDYKAPTDQASDNPSDNKKNAEH